MKRITLLSAAVLLPVFGSSAEVSEESLAADVAHHRSLTDYD